MSIKKIAERLEILMELNLHLALQLNVAEPIVRRLSEELNEIKLGPTDKRKTAWSEERKQKHSEKMAKKWEYKKLGLYVWDFIDAPPLPVQNLPRLKKMLSGASLQWIKDQLEADGNGFVFLDRTTLRYRVVTRSNDVSAVNFVLTRYAVNAPEGTTPASLPKSKGGRF